MKIKKIGHCCLVITLDNLTVLTDPGAFTDGQLEIKNIDLVLITHEHGDHLHTGSLKEVLANNPNAKILTNSGVGKILESEGIEFEILEGTDSTEVNGVVIEAHDGKHEEIYSEFGQVQNTGYFIDGKLFYPGDSFHNPEKPVDILALPVAGPWCSVSRAMEYALEVKPKKAFPVHDALIQDFALAPFRLPFEKFLPEAGIEFVSLNNGEEIDL